MVALLQASPVSAYLGLVPGLAAVISSVLVGLLMAVVLSPLYSILVLSGASKLYLDALGEGRPFGSRPEDGSPKPAWESYKPGPGERPSKYQSLAELAEDKDLEAEEVEELDKPASPSAAAKRKGKPAKEEEPEEVQELDFGGLEEEGGEEK